MEFNIQKISVHSVFPSLSEIPEPPESVYFRGTLPPSSNKTLAIVGSRNYTNYGKQAVEYLVSGLRHYPITIVSGLALGIDALAHKNALEAHLYTIAVPGSGISDRVLYPRTNRNLARRILEEGGGILSEFEPEFTATPWSFPKRNRIMVGLSDAVLLIEATEKSGTLITARLTSDYNRDLLAVPGNIFSEGSKGTHQFIKLGAIPVTDPEDILSALGIESTEQNNEQEHATISAEMQSVLKLLSEPKDRDSLIRALQLPESAILPLLMRMELDGLISEQNGVIHKTI